MGFNKSLYVALLVVLLLVVAVVISHRTNARDSEEAAPPSPAGSNAGRAAADLEDARKAQDQPGSEGQGADPTPAPSPASSPHGMGGFMLNQIVTGMPEGPERKQLAACTGGDKSACKRLVDTLRRACDRKKALMCFVLGEVYQDKLFDDLPNHQELGAKYLASACVLNLATGCSELGRLIFDGVGVPKDREKGLALMLAACKAEPGILCETAQGYESLSKMSEEDGPESGLWRDCKSGDKKACTELAAAQMRQCLMGVSEDCQGVCGEYVVSGSFSVTPEQAVDACQRACDANSLIHCSMLALLYSGRQRVTPNLPRALQLCKKACDGGEDSGCTLLHQLTNETSAAGSHKPRSQ